jgi:transcriptional regulator with XRE-family HTH domain
MNKVPACLIVRKLIGIVRIMATEPKVGPVGQQVAENIKGSRTRAGMSVRGLSAKLEELGRPILPSGITKIEQGGRRVDADDLVAIATALDVSPTRLLLHGGLGAEKFDELQEGEDFTPINEAVLNAVIKEQVDPGWVQYQLELLIRVLPELAKVRVVKGRSDRGEHQEES